MQATAAATTMQTEPLQLPFFKLLARNLAKIFKKDIVEIAKAIIFTCQMAFLMPSQHCESTEVSAVCDRKSK